MSIAFLNGGSSAGGIKTKVISEAAYNALSDADKNNPYVIWLIEDKSLSDTGSLITDKAVTKICVWDVYQSLPEEEKMDPKVVWIVSDKSIDDLVALGYTINDKQKSKLYNYAADVDAGAMQSAINMLIETVRGHNDLLDPVTEALPDGGMLELFQALIDKVNAHTEAFNNLATILSAPKNS